MKTSDLFVKALENEGVEYIFALPGEENLDLLDSLRKSKIKIILVRHEQAGGFMAATYGRLTGKVGVCLATLGPGATNFVTAAAYANLGGMPMVMITGQKPLKRSTQGNFQVLDTVSIFKSVTKFTKQITHSPKAKSLVREAFRVAAKERPGAVHLELPEDVAKKIMKESESTLIEPAFSRRPTAERKAVQVAIQNIEESQRPLLLIGAGANRKTTSRMLTDFVNKTGIPFFNTQMGKGVVDERHPLFLGTAALSEKDTLHKAIEKSDLIINVGHDVVEKPPFIMQPQDTRKVIHINFSSSFVAYAYFPQYEVVGDISNAIWKMCRDIRPKKYWDFSYFLKIKKRIDDHIQEGIASNDFPLTPPRIISDIRSVMPDNGIVALDNGMYKVWFAQSYRAYEPNTLLLDNALATMGAGLPSAIATRLVYPKRKVVAVCGDGGFMMNSQEIETAIRLKLDLVILILNDNAYGMIKWKQKGAGFDNFGLDFGNPDFVKYAQSYGAQGYSIQKTSEFKITLDKCLNKKGVHLIEVPISYLDNPVF